MAVVSEENDTSEPSRNSPAAGNTPSGRNFPRGGQSKRGSREGRGRSNWNQRNGYRKPVGENPTVQQTSDAVVVKTQPNSVGNSPPSPSEIPDNEPPLPQRNHQRRSYTKDQPPSVNTAPAIESAET